jgi:hypothetical protein
LVISCNGVKSESKTVFANPNYFSAIFSADICPIGSKIVVNAYANKYYSYETESGDVHKCSDVNSQSEYCDIKLENGSSILIKNLAVVNIDFDLIVRGRRHNYTIVENLTNITLVQPIVELNKGDINTSENQNQINDSNDSNLFNSGENKTGSLKGVTGAFLSSGTSSWLAVVVVLLASLIVYFLLKKKTSKPIDSESTSSNKDTTNNNTSYYSRVVYY